MEIHHSSLNYSRSKSPQFSDKSARAENSTFATNHKNDKTPSIDNIESIKAQESAADTQQLFKPPITNPVLSLQTENIVSNRPVNIHNQKAINAYIAESHQPVLKKY